MTPLSGGSIKAAADEAAPGLAEALTRWLRAFTGLFGLEMRQAGSHAILILGLVVALVVVTVFAYLFLLLAVALAIAACWGAGWVPTALVLGLGHLLAALAVAWILRRRLKQPLLRGTLKALRTEVERFS
jgi:uncharacterized membrane protein YqjE